METVVIVLGAVVAATLVAYYIHGVKILWLEGELESLSSKLDRDVYGKITPVASIFSQWDDWANDAFVRRSDLRGATGSINRDLQALLEHLGLEFVDEGCKLVPKKPRCTCDDPPES